MKRIISRLLDGLSEYLASRKGLLPSVGLTLVLLNLVVQMIPGVYFFKDVSLFLHLGVVIAILGFMLARAL